MEEHKINGQHLRAILIQHAECLDKLALHVLQDDEEAYTDTYMRARATFEVLQDILGIPLARDSE